MSDPIESTPSNPLCYRCRHRGTLVGDCHSKCEHPATEEVLSGTSIMSDIASNMPNDASLPERMIGLGTTTIKVRFSKQGIAGGWADWPVNFDPVWLEWCTGFVDVDVQLKTYATVCFAGHWPVGVAAVVVAEDEKEAEKLLAEELEDRGLQLEWKESDPSKRFKEITLDKAKAVILQDGDY